MEYLEINGGRTVGGEYTLHGAKNSVLPQLAACVLVRGMCVLHHCPELSDVEHTVTILKSLGAKVKREGTTLTVDASDITRSEIPEAYMREMRSSVLFLGALLGRCARAKLYLPGGCDIGARPIDYHLKALIQRGYAIHTNENEIFCQEESAGEENIALPFPSVGATENMILASVLRKPHTRIINAATEPEIVDLCDFLNKAGADIRGGGNRVIDIYGVPSLHSAEHTVIPDRIQAVTLMSATAITGGELYLKNVCLSHLQSVFPIFEEAGCAIYLDRRACTLKAPRRLKRIRKITTAPYPGFPTDAQATVGAMLTTARGTSLIHETVFENRQKHHTQLKRFGADITVHDTYAVIHGVKTLHPAQAECTDLRGGAAVVVAALKAQGTSTITHISHLDRGYQKIEEQLTALSANIKRICNEKES